MPRKPKASKLGETGANPVPQIDLEGREPQQVAREVLNHNLRWEVQLDILPTTIIEAPTEQDAIESYFKLYGVISSEQRVHTRRLSAT